MQDDVFALQELAFHNTIRDWIICLLVFLILLCISYLLLMLFRRQPDGDDFLSGDEDSAVYRLSLYICVFTLSSSLSCAILLPSSIASNEILIVYPDSYYLQWIKTSLLTKLWDLSGYLSRTLLFVVLPFIYLFTESAGFTGWRRGLLSRVYEAGAVLLLMVFVVCGIVFLGMCGVYSYERVGVLDVFGFVDRAVTTLGFAALMLAVPVGYAAVFVHTIRNALPYLKRGRRHARTNSGSGSFMGTPDHNSTDVLQSDREDALLMERDMLLRRRAKASVIDNGDANFSSFDENRLNSIEEKLEKLEKRSKTSIRQRILSFFSILMARILSWIYDCQPLVLALLTVASVVLSFLTTSFAALDRIIPITNDWAPLALDEQLRLGHESLSRLGIFGSTLGSFLQLCIAIAAIVGVYQLPIGRSLRPKVGDTPVAQLILTCTLWLLLAQAFPAFCYCLGLTKFPLFSTFRRSSDWLFSNAYVTTVIDLIYLGLIVLNFVNALTAPLVNEFIQLLLAIWRRLRNWISLHIEPFFRGANVPAPTGVVAVPVSSNEVHSNGTNHDIASTLSIDAHNITASSS